MLWALVRHDEQVILFPIPADTRSVLNHNYSWLCASFISTSFEYSEKGRKHTAVEHKMITRTIARCNIHNLSDMYFTQV